MKAFIIYLPQKENSFNHAQIMKETLKAYGHDVKLFEGIPGDVAEKLAKKEKRLAYPYGIKSKEIDVEDIKDFIKEELWDKFKDDYIVNVYEKSKYVGDQINKISTPGVKGCFYSHYKLWQKCVDLNEPIMIFEDDVKLYRNVIFDDTDWQGVLILAFGKQLYKSDPYQTYLENPEGSPKVVPWKNSSLPGTQGYAIKPETARKLIKHYRYWFLPSDNAIHSSLCKIEISTHIMGRELFAEEGNTSAVREKGQLW